MNEQQRLSVLQAWTQARALLSAGFTVEQATRLIQLREHWQPKLDRESAVFDNRLAFLKWLVEHGKVSDL